MALVSVGSTAHYNISYDDSLSNADGLTRAQNLLATCEQDYTLMSRWFGDISLTVGIPVAVNIVPGGYAGAGMGTTHQSQTWQWIRDGRSALPSGSRSY